MIGENRDIEKEGSKKPERIYQACVWRAKVWYASSGADTSTGLRTSAHETYCLKYGWRCTITTILRALPSRINEATASSERSVSVSGGVLSSIGLEISWPIVKSGSPNCGLRNHSLLC